MNKTIIKLQRTIATMPSLKKVAAYARVSSGKDEMLHSLAAQVSYYSNYIQKHPGWLYAGVYTDEAFTGTKSDRPEFNRLIEDCRNGKVDLVLTKSISRFARNTVVLLETVRELKSMDVDVFFEEQNINTMSKDGELMLTILASYAQEESLSVSENCKWRIRKQFQQGELANLRFMYGYKITKRGIEINEEQASVVRDIFSDYISGLGGDKIAKKLNQLGIKPYRHTLWSRVSVMAILKNEKYTGNALLQKRYVNDHLTKRLVINSGQMASYFVESSHPAIVDQSVFDAVQETVKERCTVKSNTRNRYEFSSFIRCGICGKKYKHRISKGKTYWVCSTNKQKGKTFCPAKQIPEYALIENCKELLGFDELNQEALKSRIREILILENTIIRITLSNGSFIEKSWSHRSRRDSWSEEMREKARLLACKQRSEK